MNPVGEDEFDELEIYAKSDGARSAVEKRRRYNRTAAAA
jgi:hypothetical protein